jgi:hypothetical protein
MDRTLTLPTVFRYTFSTLVALFALFITLAGIIESKTNFWKFVPWYISLLIFFFVLTFLAMVEGLHVCVVEVARHDPIRYKAQYPRAYRVHQLTNCT